MAAIDVGYRPRVWQAHCHRLRRTQRVRRVDWTGVIMLLVLVVHRRAGKTVWCLMELLDSALAHQGGDGRYAYIAPELKQAKRVAWDYLKSLVSTIPSVKVREAELYVELPNGSRISLYGADNPDSLRGIYLDGCVLDEVAQMKRETWEAVIQIALMDRKGWAVMIGTVAGVDLLSESYFEAVSDNSGTMAAALYTADETDVFTQAELDEKRRTMTPAHFAREFMCDFGAGGKDQLISLDLVNAAMKRSPRKDAFDFAPRVLGVDPAFAEDGDRAVIMPRQGLMTYMPEVYRGISNMRLAEAVAQYATKWKADAIFVDRGRGEGVLSRLQQLGFSPVGVDFGGVPRDRRYRNKKAEMYVEVLGYLQEGGALPNRAELRTDLCGLRVKWGNQTHRLEIEYDENLPSPDEAAALAVTFAYEVMPPARGEEDALTRLFSQTKAAKIERDPYYDI